MPMKSSPDYSSHVVQNHSARVRTTGVTAAISALLVLAFSLSACGRAESPTPVAGPGTESDVAHTAAPAMASVALGTGDDLFAQGNALSAEGKFAEAEAVYRQAIVIDPKKASYWQNLGVTYYQLQRLSDAEQSLKTGLQLTPNDAQLNYLLGIVYLQMARYSDSSIYLLKANQLDPNLPEAYYGLGALYKQQGKRDEAIRAFERFLELGPGQDPSAIPNAQAELEALRAGQ